MRWPATLVLVAFTACSDRTADYPEDFTEEVEHICDQVCEKDTTCVDPPHVEYDECMVACTVPGGMHDDTICGEAFRAYFGCIADTATCAEYLDTYNVDAQNYTCKDETLRLVDLKCGAQEGSD